MSDVSMPHCPRCKRVEYDCVCADLFFVNVDDYPEVNLKQDMEDVSAELFGIACQLHRDYPESRHFMFTHNGEDFCEVLIPPHRRAMS